MLDTNTCIFLMQQRPVEVLERFRRLSFGEVGVSSVTIAELEYGVAASVRKEENARRLKGFLAPLVILDFDTVAAAAYGEVRARLKRRGEMIGPLDCLIASHALSRDLVVVTDNEREFRRVEGLVVENWVDVG